jgi:hypothetical protein
MILEVMTALLVQRLPDPFRDHYRIVIYREDHNPLEAVRARDEDSESPFERVGRDPGFVRRAYVFAAGNDSSFDALAPMARDTFDIEDRERHTAQLKRPNDRTHTGQVERHDIGKYR